MGAPPPPLGLEAKIPPADPVAKICDAPLVSQKRIAAIPTSGNATSEDARRKTPENLPSLRPMPKYNRRGPRECLIQTNREYCAGANRLTRQRPTSARRLGEVAQLRPIRRRGRIADRAHMLCELHEWRRRSRSILLGVRELRGPISRNHKLRETRTQLANPLRSAFR